MPKKNLKIAWDTQIPNSYDQFTDNSRTLHGGKADTRESIDADRLVDSSRTLEGTGSLGKAPGTGEQNIPDDATRKFRP